MRKTISVLMLIFLLVCFLVSCGGGKGGASDTVETFFDAAHRGEIDKAFECVAIENPAAPSENYILSLEGMIKETKIVSEDTHREKYDDYEVEVAEVEANVYFLPEKQEYERAGIIYKVHLARLVTGKKTGWKIGFIITEGVIKAGEGGEIEPQIREETQSYEQGQRTEEKVFTLSNYPRSPNSQSPVEMAAASYFLMKEEKYDIVRDLIAGSDEDIKNFEEQAAIIGPEAFGGVIRIEIIQVEVRGEKARVDCWVYYEGKTKADKRSVLLVRKEGEWKLWLGGL